MIEVMVMKNKLFITTLFLLIGSSVFAQNQSFIVTPLGRQAEPFPRLDSRNIAFNTAIVTFEKGNGRFAFDTWLDYYASVSIISANGIYERANAGDRGDNGTYHVPWKFLPEGETDVVKARIELIDKNFDPESVIFATQQGTIFNHTFDPRTKTYTINLVAGQDNDVQEIFATYRLSSQRFPTLGRLNVVTYRKQTPKVTVVFVNRHEINPTNLKRELDNIFLPVGVDWQVSTDEFSASFDGNFFERGSGLLSNYNEQMLKLQRAYREARGGLDRNTNYIFILNHSGDGTNDRNTAGFMPRGGQFGYLFLSNITPRSQVYNIIAHELGHGRWRLRHTFDSSYGNTAVSMQGRTNNLMDYSNGTHLAKWQWNQMNEPAILGAIFDSDEEAEWRGMRCLAPRPNKTATREAETTTTQGRASLPAGTAAVSMECERTWHYHQGSERRTRSGRDRRFSAGWYSTEEYIEIIKPAIKGFLILNGAEIIRAGNFTVDMLEFHYVDEFQFFYTNFDIDEEALENLLTDEVINSIYEDLRKEVEAIFLNMSGQTKPLIDVFDWMTAGIGGLIRNLSTRVASRAALQTASRGTFITTVRNALGKSATASFRVGDEIAGQTIVRIKQGTNGKYIVIGRTMPERVIPTAKAINAEHWTGFNSALSQAENVANNRIWIRTKLSEGYTVIDIGLDPKFVNVGNLDPGVYYAMELFEVFGIR